jgi:Type I phosphodiesterase / nucleotide pyrophosphatase
MRTGTSFIPWIRWTSGFPWGAASTCRGASSLRCRACTGGRCRSGVFSGASGIRWASPDGGVPGRRLTWPPELAEKLEDIAPGPQELEDLLAKLHYADCKPPLLEERTGVKKILLQDEFYFRIAKKMWPGAKRGFYSVYFRSVDLASHVALHFRYGQPLRAGCPETVRDIVDETYVQVDAWIGELLRTIPEGATVIVVSDHGEQPISGAGDHAPYGIFIAAGDGIRKGETFHGASVLDVAPTVLHLFDAPIPLDMDGKVLAQIFEGPWLESHPPHYADIDTSFSTNEEAQAEGNEEILEQLKALGYIE